MFGAVGHHIGDEAHRGNRRENVGAARDVFFEYVVLHGAAEFFERDAAPAGNREHQGEQNGGRRVDRHRDGHAVERDVGEERFDVRDRVDRDADLTHLAA